MAGCRLLLKLGPGWRVVNKTLSRFGIMLGQVVQLGGTVTLYGRRNCAIGIVSQLLWVTASANLASAVFLSVDRPL